MRQERVKKIRKFLAAIVFLVMLLVGYNTALSVRQSAAQSVSGTFWGCHPPAPCDPAGTAVSLELLLEVALHEITSFIERMLENFTAMLVENTVLANLERINETEMNISDWWRTFWDYNMHPSLQAATRQLNTSGSSQTRARLAVMDADAAVETSLALEEEELHDARVFRPSENACVAATTSGGYGRQASFNKSMRIAYAKEAQAPGLNKKGTPGATGAAPIQRLRQKDYKEIFCDPDSNGGLTECEAPDAKYHNADVQPSQFIHNKLTLDVTDPKMAKTVETIQTNMVGTTAAEPISGGALKSAPGEETFLDRRSFLARHAAARSILQLSTGWRMPGSQAGPWVKALRDGAGIPLTDISDSPSYKEIMHSMAVDRFNSGHYARDMVTEEAEIEMEKLTLNAFYLMQLRDYHDLLERTALTLAVQVSILADQVPIPSAESARKLRQ